MRLLPALPATQIAMVTLLCPESHLRCDHRCCCWSELQLIQGAGVLQVCQWNLAQLASAFVKGELLDIVSASGFLML